MSDNLVYHLLTLNAFQKMKNWFNEWLIIIVEYKYFIHILKNLQKFQKVTCKGYIHFEYVTI